MEIISPSVKIETPIDPEKILTNLERYGRTAYKSEDKITATSAAKFIANIMERGHESIIEHESLTVRFICDRGVTHELVRHRLCAFTQESTRYCNYYKRGIQVIKPVFWKEGSNEYLIWVDAMKQAQDNYNMLVSNGCSPQQARSVLPNSLKTEIVVTANLREWRHILKLRADIQAHPQMQEIMTILKKELQEKLPVIFGDL
jgi:thymidylate synthase (FAD)